MTTEAPGFTVAAVELHERPVRMRLPFRFGVVTLTEAPQVFVRARSRLADAREGWGAGGARCFMAAEDLTTQAGLAVQQDLALANLLGLTHVERNGHHCVNDVAGLPAAEVVRREARDLRRDRARRE